MKSISVATLILLTALATSAFGQNYTSNGSGSWTLGSKWVGGSAPATAGQDWGTININHDLVISSNYDFRSTLNVNSGKTLQITGNLAISNGATINVYGNLRVNGNATLNANLRIHPGGTAYIDGNATVINATYVTVGTNVAPGSYADLVVKGNLVSQSSGDIVTNRNGRMAIFKDFTSDTGGGSRLTINSGGQVYINGNVNLTGGSDRIINSNGTTPIGFYTNGTLVASGGGASIDSNRGDQATMKSNDLPFYNWVAGLTDSPLPVTLIFFKISEVNAEGLVLNWATASEKNFDKFIVERSADGLTFSAIAQIVGAGNSQVTLNYNFNDQSPLVGKSYYRLKSTDFDGAYDYSAVVAATVADTKTMTVYPNPSLGESLSFSTNFAPQTGDQIIVMDFFGSEVAKASVASTNGEIKFHTTLRSGTYLVKYVSAQYERIERLVVK
jgi:hypothetical protein